MKIFQLFFLSSVLANLLYINHAKKSKKLKEMLKTAENTIAIQDELLKNRRESMKSKKVVKNEECQLCLPGFHTGRIHSSAFEYKKKHGIMTSEKAVEICETDLACGGFTFYGSNENPDKKHYMFFVHYIPVTQGIETEDLTWPRDQRGFLTWNTYRSKKKVLVLSGKSHLRKIKLPVTINDDIMNGIESKSWPFSDEIVSVSYSKNEANGQDTFTLQDHDFKAEGWKTFLAYDKTHTNMVKDGNTWSLNRGCHSYPKPLENVALRFTGELHETIETIECEKLLKEEFQDKYLKTKIPIKIKGCKEPEIKILEKFKWQGQIISRIEGDQSVNVVDVTETKRKSLIEKGFLLKFENSQNDMEDSENHISKTVFNLEFVPEIAGDQNEINDDPKFEATFISKGSGNMGKFETSKEKFDFLINGTKWWAISTAGVADAWSCHHFINEVTTYLPNSNTGVQNYLDPFWYAASWFNYIQPQLALTRYYGHYVYMTIQNPGEIIYIPSHCKYSNYAIDDSFSLQKVINGEMTN